MRALLLAALGMIATIATAGQVASSLGFFGRLTQMRGR
jgi:hypothetical protein